MHGVTSSYPYSANNNISREPNTSLPGPLRVVLCYCLDWSALHLVPTIVLSVAVGGKYLPFDIPAGLSTHQTARHLEAGQLVAPDAQLSSAGVWLVSRGGNPLQTHLFVSLLVLGVDNNELVNTLMCPSSSGPLVLGRGTLATWRPLTQTHSSPPQCSGSWEARTPYSQTLWSSVREFSGVRKEAMTSPRCPIELWVLSLSPVLQPHLRSSLLPALC